MHKSKNANVCLSEAGRKHAEAIFGPALPEGVSACDLLERGGVELLESALRSTDGAKVAKVCNLQNCPDAPALSRRQYRAAVASVTETHALETAITARNQHRAQVKRTILREAQEILDQRNRRARLFGVTLK